MSRRIRAHLRSNVVGYLALFCFAMSGTATALDGTNTVFSDDLVNGEVKSVDIATGGVAAVDIANDSVGSAKILPESVQTTDIAMGAVRSPDVLDNALTAADVADTNSLGPAEIGELGDAELAAGSVSRDEFLPGVFFGGDIANSTSFDDVEIPDNAIQSNEISDGAVGAPDLNVIVRTGAETDVPGGGALTTVTVSCEMGEKALGGGATNGGVSGVYITQSLPDWDENNVPTGWLATLENQNVNQTSGIAWVICAEAGTTGESPEDRR